MKHSSLMLALMIVLAAANGYSIDKKAASDHRMAASLQDLVSGIVSGARTEKALSSIDAEAYMIDGKNMGPLRDAVRGTASACLVVEGKDSKIDFQSLIIADDKSSAFMVMKTTSPRFGVRYHSIVFFHNRSDGWKIKNWHASN